MDIEKEVKEIHKKYEAWNDSRTTEFESDLESWLYEQGYDIDDVPHPLAYICGFKAGAEAMEKEMIDAIKKAEEELLNMPEEKCFGN